MMHSTSERPTVQLIERNDRERQALQRLLESLGVDVEAFGSPGERQPGSGECLLWSLDGVDPRRDELDEVVSEIREGTSVVVLGRAPGVPTVVRALKAGAVNVLCKPVDGEELRQAVQEALERSDSERLDRMLILELRQRLDRLTTREHDVFLRLITGQLNKQVGAQLGITERTVKAHRASILRKVGVGSVAELVRLAITLELTSRHLAERQAVANKQLVRASAGRTSLSA